MEKKDYPIFIKFVFYGYKQNLWFLKSAFLVFDIGNALILDLLSWREKCI